MERQSSKLQKQQQQHMVVDKIEIEKEKYLYLRDKKWLASDVKQSGQQRRHQCENFTHKHAYLHMYIHIYVHKCVSAYYTRFCWVASSKGALRRV